MNLEFLTTPEGQKATAFVTAFIILFAFALGAHPFKSKKRLVLASAENLNLLTAGDYFTFLSSIIRSSPTLEKLNETMPLIDGFFDKQYRVPISNNQLKQYYARLLEVYCNRENELTTIPVELCNN
jgi:hypothetical protein